MPIEDYFDLCALLSLEPDPSAKLDLSLAKIICALAALGGEKNINIYQIAPWLKLGMGGGIEDEIFQQLDEGKNMDEIIESPEIKEYNRKVGAAMGKQLESICNAANKRK